MPFTIAVLDDPADVPTITAIQWAALQDNPLIQTLYPRGLTRDLADFTSTSYLNARRYSSVRLVKATNVQTGQLVAFAKWILYRQDQPESEQRADALADGDGKGTRRDNGWHKEKTRPLPPDCYTRALEEWNSNVTRTRLAIIGNRPHACMSAPNHSLSCYFGCYSTNLFVLDILHTLPSEQGKGAGALLVKWGTDLADKEGLQCYTETPLAGHALFRHCGFEDMTELSINLGRYKEGYTEYKHAVMFRPPFGIGQPDQVPPLPPKDLEQCQWPLTVHDSLWDTISEAEGEECPTLQYTAEARMLDMRSSTSTGSPRLGSVAELRATASAGDLLSSASTGSVSKLGSVTNAKSSLRDLRLSALTDLR